MRTTELQWKKKDRQTGVYLPHLCHFIVFWNCKLFASFHIENWKLCQRKWNDIGYSFALNAGSAEKGFSLNFRFFSRPTVSSHTFLQARRFWYEIPKAKRVCSVSFLMYGPGRTVIHLLMGLLEQWVCPLFGTCHMVLPQIFTNRNSNCVTVIFSTVSFILSWKEGGGMSIPGGMLRGAYPIEEGWLSGVCPRVEYPSGWVCWGWVSHRGCIP